MLTTEEHAASTLSTGVTTLDVFNQTRNLEEQRRAQFASRLEVSADAYVVRRAVPGAPAVGESASGGASAWGDYHTSSSCTTTTPAGISHASRSEHRATIRYRGLQRAHLSTEALATRYLVQA